MLRRLVAGSVLGAVLLVSAPPAQAQDCGGQGRYIVWLRRGLIVFPSPTAADYDAGWLEAPPAEVIVAPRGRRYRGWELCLRAERGTLGGGGYGKPIADIQFRQEGSGSWTPLTTSNQLLAVGDRIRRVRLQFRVALDWERDVPGTYRMDYTATAARQ